MPDFLKKKLLVRCKKAFLLFIIFFHDVGLIGKPGHEYADDSGNPA